MREKVVSKWLYKYHFSKRKVDERTRGKNVKRRKNNRKRDD